MADPLWSKTAMQKDSLTCSPALRPKDYILHSAVCCIAICIFASIACVQTIAFTAIADYCNCNGLWVTHKVTHKQITTIPYHTVQELHEIA